MSNRTHLTDFLRRNAEKSGKQAALIFEGKTMSWNDLWQRTLSASAEVSSQFGNRKQEIVAILAPNSPEFIITYLAVVHAGHIAMPLDISFKKMELDPIIAAVRPAGLLATRQMSHLFDEEIYLIEDLLAAGSEHRAQTLRLPPDKQISTLFLSSGTTGHPKLIPNTHANILWDIKAIAGPMGWTTDDKVLINLHLSHRHGLVICFLGAVYHGNTVHLEERFSPQQTLEALAAGDVSLYSAVPSIYEKLVEFEPATRFDLSAVRLFASSSSPLPFYLRQAFEQRFGRQILDRYGTSETGSIAISQPSQAGYFGDLLEGVKLRLDDKGQVILKSPGLFPGYYRDSKATRQNTTEDGWWRTGDIGEWHDGQLVLKGRAQERIIKSGYSIYPQDIEWAILQNSQVKEVRVISLPTADRVDDKVVAFYSGSIGRQTLKEYSKDNLPRSWRPDSYVRLSELPKTPNGKVQLKKLREMALTSHV